MRGTVVITGWTYARISWPRCRRPVGRSHPSLLLDGELARAVRTEAAAAVMFWWGVSVVHRWRRFLDVTRTSNPGTHRRLTPVGSHIHLVHYRRRLLSLPQDPRRHRLLSRQTPHAGPFRRALDGVRGP
jgi:hypothetical protein